MHRLRFWIICLLLFTGLALNIERLDIGQTENVVNLDSFVYILAGISLITTLLIPRKWKISTLSLVFVWLIVYFIAKLTLPLYHPLIGGVYTYLTFTEIVVLVGIIVLTRLVVINLHSLEETVANITISDVSSRVQNFEVAIKDVNKEFARSRRYKRPLGVIVIKFKPENFQSDIGDLSKDILKLIMSRYTMGNLVRILDQEIRRPDLIIEQFNENRIVLLLPEANREAVNAVSTNVQKIAKNKIGSSVNIGVATFPDDAITFDDLVSQADNLTKEMTQGGSTDDQSVEVTPLEESTNIENV